MWPVRYSMLPFLLIIQIIFGNSFDQLLEDDKLLDNVDWSCKSDVKCTVEGSSCIEGQCQCSPGYVYNSDMTSCLRVATMYGDTCNETIQCSRYLLTGGKCIDNACSCAPGFHYLHGRCYETIELGGECESDENCHINHEFGSTICDNRICKCRTGFYQREYRSCRPAASKVGDKCLFDRDCIFDENAICKNFVCALEEKKESYYRTLEASHELPHMESYNEPEVVTQWNNCDKDSDCNIHGEAICGSSGQCICKRAHFVPPKAKTLVCVPELGEPCQTNDTVSITDSICQNGIWNCNFKKVASMNNQNCLKATRTYNKSCQQDEHCYAFGPDAVCNNKKCLCNENSRFIEEQQFCWMNRKAGDSCRANEDCYIEGLSGTLVCTDNVCDCPEGMHLNSKGTACINNKAELGAFCELDEQCIIANSVCKDNVCSCNETYYEIRKRCYLGINATCEVNSPNKCQPRYSTCSSGVCTCMKGYTAISTSICLQEKKYGEVCTHDVQCNGETPDAICVSNSSYPSSMKFCTCSEDRQYRYSECLRKRLLGESCMSKGECYLDFDKNRAICMNGICTCDWPYVQVSDTLCQKNLKGRIFMPNGAIETFSRTCLPILSISLILLPDLIQ